MGDYTAGFIALYTLAAIPFLLAIFGGVKKTHKSRQGN